jgi:hypothetical protein
LEAKKITAVNVISGWEALKKKPSSAIIVGLDPRKITVSSAENDIKILENRQSINFKLFCFISDKIPT